MRIADGWKSAEINLRRLDIDKDCWLFDWTEEFFEAIEPVKLENEKGVVYVVDDVDMCVEHACDWWFGDLDENGYGATDLDFLFVRYVHGRPHTFLDWRLRDIERAQSARDRKIPLNDMVLFDGIKL